MSVSVKTQSDWPYDVFLCHTSKDKDKVTEIAQQLKTSGLTVWLDEWELLPGQPWKQKLDERLLEVGSVAIFVGPSGEAPWSDLDVQAFLLEFVRLNCPIIPVVLDEASAQPELPSYIQGQSWVDFRQGQSNPIEQLFERISSKQEFALARPTLAYPDEYPETSEALPSDNIPPDESDFDADAVTEGIAPPSEPEDIHHAQSREPGTENPQPTIMELHQGIFVQLADGVGLEVRNIPAGTFLMGSPPFEEGSDDDERPQHNVTVSAFSIGSYPVTQAQWKVVAGWPGVNRGLEATPSGFEGDNRPVETITYDQAQEFCDRLTEQTGRLFRLPSEAEWEYACRSGTKTPYHFGEELTAEMANYLDTHNQTTDVGQYPANGYGIYDMHGNVWEWCSDRWHNSYHNSPATSEPWVQSEFADTRVLRGGSWDTDPISCRSSYRIGCKFDGCDYFIGFRVVCES